MNERIQIHVDLGGVHNICESGSFEVISLHGIIIFKSKELNIHIQMDHNKLYSILVLDKIAGD